MTSAADRGKPRMRCSLFRVAISAAADSGRPLGPVTTRHLRGCSDCRRFQRVCRVLDETLRSEAGPHTRHSLADLPRVRRRGPVRFALAAAACLVVGVSAFWLGGRKLPTAPAAIPYTVSIPHIDLAAGWIGALEAPLIAEARNLSNDAGSGIRFLAACLAVRPADDLADPWAVESLSSPD